MSHQVHFGRSPSHDDGGMRSSHAAEVSRRHVSGEPAPTEAKLQQKKPTVRNAEPAPQPAMPQHGRA